MAFVNCVSCRVIFWNENDNVVCATRSFYKSENFYMKVNWIRHWSLQRVSHPLANQLFKKQKRDRKVFDATLAKMNTTEYLESNFIYIERCMKEKMIFHDFSQTFFQDLAHFCMHKNSIKLNLKNALATMKWEIVWNNF